MSFPPLKKSDCFSLTVPFSEIHTQLASLRARSDLLESELERTKRTAQSVEEERNSALRGLEKARMEVDRLRKRMDSDVNYGAKPRNTSRPNEFVSRINLPSDESDNLPDQSMHERPPSATRVPKEQARQNATDTQADLSITMEDSFLLPDEIEQLQKEIEAERKEKNELKTLQNIPVCLVPAFA